jgi:hypothetical protein
MGEIFLSCMREISLLCMRAFRKNIYVVKSSVKQKQLKLLTPPSTLDGAIHFGIFIEWRTTQWSK